MDTLFANTVFDCARWHLMKSAYQRTVWHDRKDTGIPFFVGMAQVYTDRTTTSLKENATAAYPVYIVIINCARTYRR